ncbi:MAG: hypothetical protein K2K96_01695 [Lachnospiraceae bacterium]|nr:hypothetical protein [Lachnospiraceae bacterium]
MAANARNEQQFFIRTLHHANHGSYVSRFLAGKGQYSSTNLAEIESYDENYNTYVSLHSFSRYGRRAEDIREITCIYYDLDMHEKHPMSYIEECTENTLQVLYDAIYGDEELPEPTIITRTGRGLGLFYVLDRSIACAKGRNAGQVEFWKLIYRRMGEKIKTILVPENNRLADDPEALLELDERVICDVSRVTRMPGTWNQKAGKECRVVFPEQKPRYYSLKELSAYIFSEVYTAENTEDPPAEKPKVVIKRKRSGNIVEFDFFLKAFLQERIEALEKLQAFRKGKGIGCRDYMCFTYYNHVKQLYGVDQAIKMLASFNNAYENPLSESEIRNIARGIDRCSGDTYEGHYKLTNEWIVRNLKVSVLERDVLDFDVSKRKLQRKMAHQDAVRVREERNREIAEYIECHPEEIYASIAARFDVSLRTLKSIAKEAGIRRNRKVEKPIEIERQGKERKEQSEKICKKKEDAKSAKICPIVCCDSPDKGEGVGENHLMRIMGDACIRMLVSETEPIRTAHGADISSGSEASTDVRCRDP